MHERLSHQDASSASVAPLKREIAEVAEAARVLSLQHANIVFEHHTRAAAWVFRRGSIQLPVPPSVCERLGNRLQRSGQSSLMFSLRGHAQEDISMGLHGALNDATDVASAFECLALPVHASYRKVLLVPPYGDHHGHPLKYLLPHYGVEMVAYRLLRETPHVDARVFNPNLASVAELYDLVARERFDAIGFSVLMLVLAHNLEIIGKVSTLAPESLMVLGGRDLASFKMNEIFASLGCDLCVLDDGSALIELFNRVSPLQRPLPFDVLRIIPNVVFMRDGLPFRSPTKGIVFNPVQKREDIPIDAPDLTHGRAYTSFNDGLMDAFVPVDRVGARPLPILYGTECKGRCIFCSTERNTMKPPDAQAVLDYLQENVTRSSHDSLNFDSSDFLSAEAPVRSLCEALIEGGFEPMPKKVTARVDNVGDGSILKLMKRAGFTLVAYGIESFDDRVLAEIGKGTTRAQNINALELTLRAGLRPGLNLILFTPWDTIQSTLDTIRTALPFIVQGGYANVVPRINIIYGTPMSRRTEIIDYGTYRFDGMKRGLSIPLAGRVLDPALEALVPRVLEIERELEGEYDGPFAQTVAVYSLLLFKAFFLAEREAAARQSRSVDYSADIAAVDEALEKTLLAMQASVTHGVHRPLRYGDFAHVDIPPSDDDSSLKMEEYLSSKFPAQFYMVLRSKAAPIELHRGPQSMTEHHFELLRSEGWTISEVKPEEPKIRRFYELHGPRGEERFVISNMIGPNRELFIVQALKYLRYPEGLLSIRTFPAEARSILIEDLKNHIGNIDTVLLAHSVDELVLPTIRALDPDARVFPIQNDYLKGSVVELCLGRKLLLWDVEYLNGEHVAPMLDFMSSSTEHRGLSAREVIMYAACGSSDDDSDIFDLVLPSEAQLLTGQIAQFAENGLSAEQLRRHAERRTAIRRGTFFTIPSILNSSLELVRTYHELAPRCALDLESAHAIEEMKRHPGTSFRLLYEIHDKPALTSNTEKTQTLGKDVPAYKDNGRRKANVRTLLQSLMEGWELEKAVREDAAKVGAETSISRTGKLVVDYPELKDEVVAVLASSRESPAFVSISGLSGTGKTKYVTEKLQNDLGAEDDRISCGVLHGDAFLQPKNKRVPGTTFIDCYDMDALTFSIEQLKAGSLVAFRIYDPVMRQQAQLSPQRLEQLKKTAPHVLLVSLMDSQTVLLEDPSKPFVRNCANRDASVGVDPVTGLIYEVLRPGKSVYIIDFGLALMSKSVRELPGTSIFVWASPRRRLEYLQIAKQAGERLKYDNIENRMARYREELDPISYAVLSSAHIVYVNDKPLVEEIERRFY